MATNPNNVFLSPYGTQIKKERLLNAGIAVPGNVMVYAGAGNIITNNTADLVGPLYVADLSVSVAGAIDTQYDLVDNIRVNYKMPQRGDLVRFRVGQNTTIVVDDELATALIGNVDVPSVAGTAVIAIATTAVTTGAGETGFVIGEVI
jgi:hypothetical protein